MKRSRVDIIGQNGNEGEHYEEVDKMSGGMDKDESCFGCVNFYMGYDKGPCVTCTRAFSGNQEDHYKEGEGVVDWSGDDFCPSCDNLGSTLCTECGDAPLTDCGVDFLPLHWKFNNKIRWESEEEKKLDKEVEKEHLTKLIDDHWAYIEKLLEAHDTDKDIIEVAKFHYKSAGLHFWKHAMEYMEEKDD